MNKSYSSFHKRTSSPSGGILQIKVGLNFGETTRPVGRLASRERRIYFEYDAEFLTRNLEISPLKLPLESGVKTFDPHLFEGLPGVFNDSLPDGWGRLLLDRYLRSQHVSPENISALDRLAHVGVSGVGALVYEPDYSGEGINERIDLDILSTQTQEVLNGEAEEILAELIALNGSSAGARPKAMIGVDKTRNNIIHGKQNSQEGYEPWIVKFANTSDGQDVGAIEYVYALMAKEAGIEMADTHLFPANKGAGYFASKRFDRDGQKRIHMHSICGLLHSDFRTPSLDYEDLMALTGILTRDIREVEKMFRLAVFNVLANNRDDHSKNFSFLMSEDGEWMLSPAYDLTFSSGPSGEQSTLVMGEGKNPSVEHLKQLGKEAKISSAKINEAINQTRHAVSQWKTLAQKYGVSKANIKLIGEKIG